MDKVYMDMFVNGQTFRFPGPEDVDPQRPATLTEIGEDWRNHIHGMLNVTLEDVNGRIIVMGSHAIQNAIFVFSVDNR